MSRRDTALAGGGSATCPTHDDPRRAGVVGRTQLARVLIAAFLVALASSETCALNPVPGMWGTTDTTRPESIKWPENWRGARDRRAQWWKIFAEAPSAWKYENHAKGELPGSTYYLWRYDKPLPAGTKILIEGDFPYARFMNFQVCAPWTPQLPFIGDGTGIPEVALLDEDIVPDPGHVNPFLPGADRRAKQRHYHITFELQDGHPGDLNPEAVRFPYRAPGNLRYGCRRLGKEGERGPLIWQRIYLPDGYEPYGGVPTPVIRIQLPGKKAVLAPVVRDVELSLTDVPKPYGVDDNPAQADGRSVKELESQRTLRQRALDGMRKAGRPGDFVRATLRFAEPDGSINLVKLFGTPLFLGWMRHYKDEDFCRKLPAIYGKLYGMGFEKRPPANDERVSGHNLHATYLTSAASIKADLFLVFRGKGPKTPRTLSGEATMGSSEQLRYWSINMMVGHPMKLTPVVNIVDEDVVLDANDQFMIVVGREEDRPRNANADHGVTWAPWPVGNSMALLLRYVSTEKNPWRHAPQLIDWPDSYYCEPDKWRKAVERHMGEYYPKPTYMTRRQIEQLDRIGQPPYSKHRSW